MSGEGGEEETAERVTDASELCELGRWNDVVVCYPHSPRAFDRRVSRLLARTLGLDFVAHHRPFRPPRCVCVCLVCVCVCTGRDRAASAGNRRRSRLANNNPFNVYSSPIERRLEVLALARYRVSLDEAKRDTGSVPALRDTARGERSEHGVSGEGGEEQRPPNGRGRAPPSKLGRARARARYARRALATSTDCRSSPRVPSWTAASIW